MAFLSGLAGLVLLAAIASPAPADEVRVFAAASLTEAMQEIAVAYHATTPDRVVFNFAASSTLARQIEQGAPSDLFASADEEQMTKLSRQGLIDTATRTSFLSNTLVIVVPSRRPTRIRVPADLAGRKVVSIALADPRIVPAGVYAKRYLQQLGLWAAVAPRIIPMDNVRAALAAVESENADAAIVYATDALRSRGGRVAYAIPQRAGPAISYPFAVTTEAENAAGGKRFLRYLASEQSRAVFRKYGFIVASPASERQHSAGWSAGILPALLNRSGTVPAGSRRTSRQNAGAP